MVDYSFLLPGNIGVGSNAPSSQEIIYTRPKPQVAGASTVAQPVQQAPVPQQQFSYNPNAVYGPSLNEVIPTSGGGGGGNNGGSGNTADDIDREFLNAINDQFKGTSSYLNSAENNLKAQLPGIESDIRSLIGDSRNQLDAQKQASEQELLQQQVAGEQRKEDALSAARRLYNELLRQGQQRFGGASSAGEAFQTLGANELQRNNSQTEREFSNFMAQVEGARTNIRNQYTTALQSLQAQEMRMVNEARRSFQDKLQEISRARGEAEDAKASMKLQALQDLRNQIFQIKYARAQEQVNLDNLLTQEEQRLQSYVQSGYNAGQNFNTNTNVDPSTNITYNAGGSDVNNMMGYRRPDEDELSGSILRPRRDELFNLG